MLKKIEHINENKVLFIAYPKYFFQFILPFLYFKI
jgi:hypothetical protein